jgi:hypothetical protein
MPFAASVVGGLPAVCHYELLAEYRDVLFRMVRREELTLSRDRVERLLAALVTATQEVRGGIRREPGDHGYAQCTRFPAARDRVAGSAG